MNSYHSVVFSCCNEQTTTKNKKIASNLSRASFTALIEFQQETNMNIFKFIHYFQPTFPFFNQSTMLLIFKIAYKSSKANVCLI